MSFPAQPRLQRAEDLRNRDEDLMQASKGRAVGKAKLEKGVFFFFFFPNINLYNIYVVVVFFGGEQQMDL